MKKLLNTLYVTTQGTYISRDGETVLVKNDDEILLRVPIHTLQGIVCFGRVSMSAPLMGFCGERQVQISFLSEPGEFQARVQGPVAGNVLLRREQYRAADDQREPLWPRSRWCRRRSPTAARCCCGRCGKTPRREAPWKGRRRRWRDRWKA